MPKFLCKCGEMLRYSDIPCKIEYKFISDEDYDSYQGSVDTEKLYSEMKSIIKCPDCNRLWVFWNGFENEPTQYIEVNK